MSINSKMHTQMTLIYRNHRHLFEAHKKLLALENNYKNRVGKDNELVINKILDIVKEVAHDN